MAVGSSYIKQWKPMTSGWDQFDKSCHWTIWNCLDKKKYMIFQFWHFSFWSSLCAYFQYDCSILPIPIRNHAEIQIWMGTFISIYRKTLCLSPPLSKPPLSKPHKIEEISIISIFHFFRLFFRKWFKIT